MTDTFAPRIPIPQLVATIRAHLAKADHSAEKSGQHFVSAGLHLAELKGRYKTEVKASKSHTWPEYVQERFGLRRSRADELIRIGEGRDTIEKTRADANERMKIARAKKSPERSGDSTSVTSTNQQSDTADDAPRKFQCAEDIAAADSDETVRRRAFLHRASEAQRHARENGFENAAPEEITDEIIAAAFIAAKTWADLMTELQHRAQRPRHERG